MYLTSASYRYQVCGSILLFTLLVKMADKTSINRSAAKIVAITLISGIFDECQHNFKLIGDSNIKFEANSICMS